MVGCRLLGPRNLDFGFCSELSNIADLARGVGALQGLQHLKLDVQRCSALSDITDLAREDGGLVSQALRPAFPGSPPSRG